MGTQDDNNEKSRRSFIKQAVFGVAGGLGLQGGLPANTQASRQEAADSFGFAAQPVLANVGADRIEVIVAPNDLAVGRVEYGPTRQLGHTAKCSIQGLLQSSDRVLHFEINNLQPGKEYFYRVHLQQVVYHTNWRMERTTKVTSDLHHFRTLDP